MAWWKPRFGRRERELDAELRDHLERQVADNRRAGMDEGEARRHAGAAFGSIEQAKDYCRDVRGTRWLSDAARDLRHGARALAASRTFTIVAVLSLALGIGANTAIFTLVNSLLLRALPVHEPERLVVLTTDEPGMAGRSASMTNPIWEEIRQRQDQLFAGAAAWSETTFDLSQGGRVRPVSGLWASGSLFELFGVPAVLGRMIGPDNDSRDAALSTVAVLGYGFWQREFGGAADVVGRTLTLNRVPFTIVGVAPPAFFGPAVGRRFDVAVPIASARALDSPRRLDNRSMWWLNVMARLRPGQTAAEATRVLRSVQPRIRDLTMPDDWPAALLPNYLSEALTFAPAARGPSQFRLRYERPLLAVMLIVGLVLLIACANVANLLLARASGRRHELTMRLALGASRARLGRQLLAESTLLAALGAAVGLIVARWGSAWLVAQFSRATHAGDGLWLDLSLDWRVLAFTAGVTVVTTVVFGVAPLAGIRQLAPIDALKEHGRASTGRRRRLAEPLVVAQIALSLVLVVGAGLFVRTFTALAALDLGFDRQDVLLVEANLRSSQTPPERYAELYQRLEAAASRVPGVAAAAVSLLTPVSGAAWNSPFEIAGVAEQPDRLQRLAFLNGVTPGWFRVYGTAIIAGRDFTAADRAGAPSVAIVNRAFARKFLKPGPAIGQIVQQSDGPDGRPPALLIVGLVEDAAYRSVREPMPPTVYLPMAQTPDASVFLAQGTISVRAAAGPPASLIRAVAAAIASVDRDVAFAFRPLVDEVDAQLVRERVLAVLGAFFGGLALLLAAVGLYGVTSYAVNLQRGEIGVRMALGADIRGILRLVLGRAARLVCLGLVVGAALSTWLSRYVAALLFGLEPGDAPTIGAAVLVMLAASVAATALPAWRAARIHPLDVLREG